MERGELAKDNDRDSLFSDRSQSPYRRRSRSRESRESVDKTFIMKNGCCRECMRAFSKTGKSCLCQVPKHERKYILSEKGCNFCSCHGCNPVDVQREKRKDIKKQLREDKRLQYRKQRLIDSDDESLNTYQNDIDDFNKKRREFLEFLAKNLNSTPSLIGFGAPLRTPSYILGYQPNERRNRRRRVDNDRRDDSK